MESHNLSVLALQFGLIDVFIVKYGGHLAELLLCLELLEAIGSIIDIISDLSVHSGRPPSILVSHLAHAGQDVLLFFLCRVFDHKLRLDVYFHVR